MLKCEFPLNQKIKTMHGRTELPSIYEFVLPDEVSLLFKTQESLHNFEPPPSDEIYKKNNRGWTEEEDGLLKRAVAQFGPGKIRWDQVSKNVPTRNMKQCRERWEFHLNPSINKEPFTVGEDRIIIMQQKKLGNRWTVIAEMLQGRTSSAVKNRWYTVLKKLSTKEIHQLMSSKSSNPSIFNAKVKKKIHR